MNVKQTTYVILSVHTCLKISLAIDGLKNSSKMRDLLRLIAFQLGSEVSYEELG